MIQNDFVRFLKGKTVNKRNVIVVVFIIVLGIILRLLAAYFSPTNFDIESYRLVGQLNYSGLSAYEYTHRYNYGPIWQYVLGFITWISKYFPDPISSFRYIVTLLIISADVGLFIVLMNYFSLAVGILFYLNPLSILLTGAHTQFDNIALLIGLFGAVLYEKSFTKKSVKTKLVSLIILGISLITKHILFLLPLWWSFKEKNLRNKLLVILLPAGLFLLSFVPFWHQSGSKIIQNVFLYKSEYSTILYTLIVPFTIQRYISPYILFIGALLIFGYLFRKKNVVNNTLMYSLVLVTFSPATANQYFAIVLPAIAVFPNVYFVAFTVMHLLLWVTSLLHRPSLVPGIAYFSLNSVGYCVQIIYLFCGVLLLFLDTKVKKVTSVIQTKFIIAIGFFVALLILLAVFDETSRINPIKKELLNENYEKANMLFTQVWETPPLPGTRFYYRILPVKQEIDDYRNYKRIEQETRNNNFSLSFLNDLSKISPTVGYYKDIIELRKLIISHN